MSFGANAIGFFLDIDASKARSEVSAFEKEYTSFVGRLDKLNKKAISTIESGLVGVANAAKRIKATPPSGASAGGRSTINESLIKELGRVFSAALSHVQLRVTPARPLKRNPIFDQAGSLIQTYKRMAQPPDFIGGFKIQKFAEGERRGPVRSHPGMRASGLSSKIGDNVLIRANEGEIISKKETYEDLVSAIRDLRGGLTTDTSKVRAMLDKQNSLIEALTRVRNAQRLGGVADQYGRMGVGVRNLGDITSEMHGGRKQLRSALAGMSQEDFQQISEALEHMDAEYASMEKHLSKMAKSTSSIRKDTRGGGGGSGGGGMFSSGALPLTYLATSQMFRDMRGGTMNLLGSAPHTQEAFARSYAQLGGTLQGGRTAFAGAYRQVGSLADENTMAQAMYHASQGGFRGGALSRVASTAALANVGSGFDTGTSVGLASALKRVGFGTNAYTVAQANIIRQAQAVGANGSLTSNVIGGSDIAGMIATRGGKNADRVLAGLGGLSSRLLVGAGNNERGASAAQSFMSLISDYGKSGVMAGDQLKALTGGFGISQDVLDRMLATGDQKEFIQNASGFSKQMLQQDPSTRAAYAQVAGMDVTQYTDALRSLADLPTKGLNDAIMSATAAIGSLSGAASNATNAASRFGNTLDNFGSQVGAKLGGAYSMITETPWERVAGFGMSAAMAFGGARGIGRMMGFGGAAGRGSRMGRMASLGMRRVGRSLSGAGSAIARGSRSMVSGGIGGMSRAAAMGARSATTRRMAMGAGRGLMGTLGRAGGAVGKIAGRVGGFLAGGRLAGGFAAMAGGGIGMGATAFAASAALNPISVITSSIGQFYAGKARAKELNFEKTDQRANYLNDLEEQIGKTTDPWEKDKLEKEWYSIRDMLKNNQRTASIDTWDQVKDSFHFSSDKIDEIESAAAQFGDNRGMASQLIALAMADTKNVHGIKDLAPLLSDLKGIKSTTVQGAISELSDKSQNLVVSGSEAQLAAASQGDDAADRDRAANSILLDIRDTLRRIAMSGRGLVSVNTGEE